MPIYEYRCGGCGHELEAMQKLADAPLKDCPECEKPELTKLISAVSFRLKGGGWYETDFKADNQKNLADGDAKKKPDAKGDGNSESKSGSDSSETKSASDKKSDSKSSSNDSKTEAKSKPKGGGGDNKAA